MSFSRREFLKTTSVLVGSTLLPAAAENRTLHEVRPDPNVQPAADYTIRIGVNPVEIARDRIISTTTYNGQFPGPLLRFKEGQPVTIDVYNDTDSPEQLHWHGQMVPFEVDGAAEEGTPFIPAHGKRRIAFTPKPAGFRFYHTHVRAGAGLSAGQYGGR